MDGFHAGDFAWFVVRDPETRKWASVRRKITRGSTDGKRVTYEAFDAVAPPERVFADVEVADYWIAKHTK